MIISSALASSPREQFSCSTYYIVTLLLLHYCYCVALCMGHVGAKSHIPLIEDATVMERWRSCVADENVALKSLIYYEQ